MPRRQESQDQDYQRYDLFDARAVRLERRGERAEAPYAYIGVHICKPPIVDAGPEGAWSMNLAWTPLLQSGRVHGVVMDAFWMHVGDPAALDLAEAELR